MLGEGPAQSDIFVRRMKTHSDWVDQGVINRGGIYWKKIVLGKVGRGVGMR